MAAGSDLRHYERHRTPVHLDFSVADIRTASKLMEAAGGVVETQSFLEVADIALCADPFIKEFCLIRE